MKAELKQAGMGEVKVKYTGMNISSLRKFLKRITFPDRSSYYGERYGQHEPVRRADMIPKDEDKG